MGFGFGGAGKAIGNAAGGLAQGAGKSIVGVMGGKKPWLAPTTPAVGGGFQGIAGGGGGSYTFDGVRPDAPDFVSPLTEDNVLSDRFTIEAGQLAAPGNLNFGSVQAGQVTPGQINVNQYRPDTAGLDAFKARALSQGDSPWMQLQAENIGNQAMQARSLADSRGAGALAGAESSLAMRGGLSSGARERLAMAGQRASAATGQDITANASNQLGQARIADETQKMQMLGQIPGMELQNQGFLAGLDKFNVGTDLAAQQQNVANELRGDMFNVQGQFGADQQNMANTMSADKFNIANQMGADQFNAQNTLGALGAKNQFAMDRYGQQMKEYSAGKSGEAIANAGKK